MSSHLIIMNQVWGHTILKTKVEGKLGECNVYHYTIKKSNQPDPMPDGDGKLVYKGGLNAIQCGSTKRNNNFGCLRSDENHDTLTEAKLCGCPWQGIDSAFMAYAIATGGVNSENYNRLLLEAPAQSSFFV